MSGFIDVAVIVVYFATVLALGFYFKARASKNLDSYFLGDKGMHWSLLAMSGAVTNFDITGTMWMVSILVVLGMQSWWHHWMWGVVMSAFGLAFMAKWVRKSGVMTGAEWMATRFGADRPGKVARYSYAFLAVVTLAAFIGYDFQGIGKFADVYIKIDDFAASISTPWLHALLTTYKPHTLAALTIGITTIYVMLGGLYSVVITDVVQTVILTFASIVICVIAYHQLTPELIAQKVPGRWVSIVPQWQIDTPEAKAAGFEFFGLLVIVWVFKGVLLNAGGPGQMYDFQRYLAARDPRDAAKLAAAWPFFLIVRWGMVAGIALLALTGISQVKDTEQVMPDILHRFLGPGLKGVVIAGLLSAFMSTFGGTINAAASYIVRDFWQPLFKPDAAGRQLVRYSHIASVGIVLAGMVIGIGAKSISSIWGWIMMALGGAVLVPNVLRWFWWRLNGWGYAAGTLGGLLLSVLALLWPSLPIYVVFPAICVGSLAAGLIGTWTTLPVDEHVLVAFYRRVRPFGLWGPVRRQAGLTPAQQADWCENPWLALFNTAVATVGITGLFLFSMYLVGHWFAYTAYCLAAALGSAIVLYFSWYRTLPPAEAREPQIVSVEKPQPAAARTDA